MKLILSDQAKEDVAQIAAYIARRSGSRKTGRDFSRKLIAKCRELASIKGTIGVERPEIRQSLRSHPFGNYIILFHYSCDAFEVVTIIEGHRDTLALFRD